MKLTFPTPALVDRARTAGLTVSLSADRNATAPTFEATVSNDVSDFLETLLWANEPEGHPDDGSQPTVYDFAPEIYAALDSFISGFRVYLEQRNVTSDDLGTLERSFGGNVYFSLSGHGCGFFDDRSELGREVQAHLEKYSGTKYRFEELDFSNDETGLLDLSYIPEAQAEYRENAFTVATPAAPKMLIGHNGRAVFYLAKQADGWTGFSQLLSAAPIPVESMAAGLALCKPDEISGLTFDLVDFPNVATLRELNR